MKAVVAAAGVAAVSLACGRGSDRDSSFTTADSAGITIVTSATPAHPDGNAFHLVEDPLLDIGGDDAAAGSIQLEHVAGVVLLPDGGLIVADESASRILRFDAGGQVLWQAGRPGDGPGEFRQIATLGLGLADSVWVFDFGNRRITLLGPDGSHARSIGITAALNAPRVVGRLDDGGFVARELFGRRPAEAQPEAGLIRDPAAVVRLSPDGSAADTIGVFPGREFWMTTESGRGVMNTPLFSKNTVVATSGSTIIVGDQERFDLRVFDPSGEPLRSIRLDGIDLTIDEALVERAMDALVETIPEPDRVAAREYLAAMPGSEMRPAFDRVIVSGTGELWVSENVPPPLIPRTWYVLDPDGRWLGTMQASDRFTIEAVDGDRVAGVWLDPLDVQQVRVYRLVRPSGR